MSPPSGEHWTTMVCMAELKEESHCSSKRKLLPMHLQFAKDHVEKQEDYWKKGLMDGLDNNRNVGFKW